MLLWQIVDSVYKNAGIRLQTPPSRILEFISYVQKIAFNKDCLAFEKTATLFPLKRKAVLFKSNHQEIFVRLNLKKTFDRVYLFGSDFRKVKEVLNEKKIYIDDFERKIKSPEKKELHVVYYRQPFDLTCENAGFINETFQNGTNLEKAALFNEQDEKKLIVPQEWRAQILVQATVALCDSENYGDKTPQSIIEQYLGEFWAEMNKRKNDRAQTYSAGAW